jgi:hypothetical protein
MSTDFLKIAQAHVASTGSDPRIVIQEMEAEIEKVGGLFSIGKMIGSAGKSRAAFKAGGGFSGMARRGVERGVGALNRMGDAGVARLGSMKSSFKEGVLKGRHGSAYKAPLQRGMGDMGSMGGFMGGKKTLSPPTSTTPSTSSGMANFMNPGGKKPTPTLEGLNPGSKKVGQLGVQSPSKSGTAPGAPPDANAPAVTGKQVAQQSEAQAAEGPGFMQKHFGLTPGNDKGILGGQGVGKWWEDISDDQKLKVMGAAGAGAAGAGYMLGGSGGGRTQVIYQ